MFVFFVFLNISTVELGYRHWVKLAFSPLTGSVIAYYHINDHFWILNGEIESWRDLLISAGADLWWCISALWVCIFSFCKLHGVKPDFLSHHSPLSISHSGDEAPLHSLRGPSTGEIRPKSDSDTVLGRSRLQGLDRGAGEDAEEEVDGVGDGEAEEEELAKGQGDSSSCGLLGDEPRLQVEWVSESSDMMLPPPHGSSSKHTDATVAEGGE